MTIKSARIAMTNKMLGQTNNPNLEAFQKGLEQNKRLYERLSSNDIIELSVLFVEASKPYRVEYLGKEN